MKKIITILTICIVGLTSCHKTVTPRKLDGEWTVTNSSGQYTDLLIGDISTINYNGTTETIASDGEVNSIDKTVSFSFDKKKGTYEIVTIGIQYDDHEKLLYSFDGTNYNISEYCNRKEVIAYKYTQIGSFIVLGKSGEIEKNTRILLTQTSSVRTEDLTYTYFNFSTSNQVTDLSGLFVEDYDSQGAYFFKPVPTTETRNYNLTGTYVDDNPPFYSNYGEILTVESLKKSEMVFVLDNTSTLTGNSSYSNTFKMKYTLKKKD